MKTKDNTFLINVSNPKLHRVGFVNSRRRGLDETSDVSIPVAEGELVLVPVHQHGGRIAWTPKQEWSTNVLLGMPYDPIIVSRTEKINVGDAWINLKDQTLGIHHSATEQDVNIITKSNHTHCTKILALPEHFSTEHLESIVNWDVFQNGTKVMVEIEEMVIPCPDNKEGCEVLHKANFVKLDANGHIIFHGVEVEKQYTRSQLKEEMYKCLLASQKEKWFVFNNAHGVVLSFTSWFDINVK